MALTESQMAELGTRAPWFDLPNANADGRTSAVSLSDFSDVSYLVVVFTCNHCPFAVHIEDALVEVARHYQSKGVAFVAISSNDARQYPADSFGNMARRAAAKGYPFPYLYDESQQVARHYGAECTPDIFVYSKDRTLTYRGRFDATRPNMRRADGADLCQALDELLVHDKVSMTQRPSMGCNIKWR